MTYMRKGAILPALLRACCRNGVREYLVWLVAEARLEWFWLEEDDYCPQLTDAQGVLHSRIFPGLQLPVAPLLAGDTAKVLATLTGPEPLNTKPPETSVNLETAVNAKTPRGKGAKDREMERERQALITHPAGEGAKQPKSLRLLPLRPPSAVLVRRTGLSANCRF